jgi:hypothetical protein
MAILSAAVPLAAHHSLGTYDQTTLVAITGVVSKVQWINPHASITLTVKDADGKVVTRDIELASPNALLRKSFDMKLVKIGDTITIESWLSKPQFGLGPAGRTLVLLDGRRFDVADNFDQLGTIRTK